MAKLTLNKLGLKSTVEIKPIVWNEQTIEVKQYLPIEDKLKIVENVLNYSAEDKRFYNVGKIEVFLTLEVFQNYTNITFTDKQKENPAKLYDNLNTSGLVNSIIEVIPEQEFLFLYKLVKKTIKSVYSYSNSVMGILEAVQQDYKDVNFDTEQIKEQLSGLDNLSMLKDILTKLG